MGLKRRRAGRKPRVAGKARAGYRCACRLSMRQFVAGAERQKSTPACAGNATRTTRGSLTGGSIAREDEALAARRDCAVDVLHRTAPGRRTVDADGGVVGVAFSSAGEASPSIMSIRANWGIRPGAHTLPRQPLWNPRAMPSTRPNCWAYRSRDAAQQRLNNCRSPTAVTADPTNSTWPAAICRIADRGSAS